MQSLEIKARSEQIAKAAAAGAKSSYSGLPVKLLQSFKFDGKHGPGRAYLHGESSPDSRELSSDTEAKCFNP